MTKAKRIELIGCGFTRISALNQLDDAEAYRIGVGAVVNYEDLDQLRMDEIIEIHLPHIVARAHDERLKNWNKLPAREACTLFMQVNSPEFPGAKPFPIDEIEKWALNFPNHYWSATSTYMMARAIMLCEQWGLTEIHTYGIHLSAHEEWAYERPCFEYWGGVANAKGINIICAEQSSTFKYTHVYGYQHQPEYVNAVLDQYKLVTEGRMELDRQVEEYIVRCATELEKEQPEHIPDVKEGAVALLVTRTQQLGAIKTLEIYMKRVGAWQDHVTATQNI